MHKLSPKQKKTALRILGAAALLLILGVADRFGVFDPPPLWGRPAVFLVPYLLIGYDILRKAGLGVVHGQVFDENFLMALATVGAFAIGEYAEAVFVMLFYQTGELFQDYAVDRSRASIAELMDLRPDTAWVERDGALVEIDPEDAEVGDVMVVKPGERLALDGVVLEGVSTLDTAALTGESAPRGVQKGDDVLSGCVNLTGLLRVWITKPCEESTVSRILELAENAGEKKAESEAFITRFAHYYTPCVVFAALALFLVPSALLAFLPAPPAFLSGTVWTDWLHRALLFLVVSCPCALVISVPLSFFGGIGGASRCGILVKGGNFLEALARTEIVVFDKTGTLTEGSFSVSGLRPAEGFTESELLESAALAELFSPHPIALSLRKAWGADPANHAVSAVQEAAGLGITAEVDGFPVSAGNLRLMETLGLHPEPVSAPGAVVYVAVGGAYAGAILLEDLPKADAASAIRALRRQGVTRTVMLTGDTEAAGRSVAEALGLDEVHAQLLPAQKVERVERLLAEKKGALVFVGDGINDAPVLTRADVGVAMGALGSDAAIEAADVVLMDDRPGKLAVAISIARRTVGIVRQNIVFALSVKALVLIMGALGLASMWLAVFADVGVAFLAILNAMRCLKAPAAS